MNKQLLGVVLFICACLQSLTLFGCGHDGKVNVDTRGMVAAEPSEVLVELIERQTSGGDFMELCSESLDEKTVNKALDAWKSCGGYYSIVVTGDNIYEEITGQPISLSKNEMALGFYGGASGDIWDIKGKGYVILSSDEKGRNFTVMGIGFEP